MRHLLALTVAVAALAAGAGCSAGPAGTADPAGAVGFGATPGTGGGSPARAGGNSPEVCAAAQEATGAAVRTYVAELNTVIGAVGANDSVTEQTARKRAEAALADWRAALRQQSTRATDPQLHTLLADLASEVDTLGTDVDAIDEEELERLQQRLDQLC